MLESQSFQYPPPEITRPATCAKVRHGLNGALCRLPSHHPSQHHVVLYDNLQEFREQLEDGIFAQALVNRSDLCGENAGADNEGYPAVLAADQWG